jgi:Second Messenger Oligonucleotide or Dinucleotide Synthetase domain
MTMETPEEVISKLLDGTVAELDITPAMRDTAITRYTAVGNYLADATEATDKDCTIFVQGSFRLGTVVRPHDEDGDGDYDIDLVNRYTYDKRAVTKDDLKATEGRLLQQYIQYAVDATPELAPTGLTQSRRAWTLHYPGMHLDILPAIPDLDVPPNGILLGDRHEYTWQHSNPIGYGQWFRRRSAELLVKAAEFERKNDVHSVPEFYIRTTLQRVVQVIKAHAAIFFAADPDNRPPSILLTTLAALAYQGESGLFTATLHAVTHMEKHIERINGEWYVANPVHPGENFADKWNDYPEREIHFRRWLADITDTLADTARMHNPGFENVALRLSEGWGTYAVKQATTRIAAEMRGLRETSNLTMRRSGQLVAGVAGGTRVRDHTFHGDH